MIDYHVHLWPHADRADETELAIERIAAYVERAAHEGVQEIALTEHFFRFVQGRAVVDGWWNDFSAPADLPFRSHAEQYFDHHATADLDRYVETVLAAKAASLPVVLGLEVDYYPGRMDSVASLLSAYPFDVLLGSVHWIGAWMFDVLDDAAQLGEWDRRPLEEVWRAYACAVEELAATGCCDVLAHPDLVKVANRIPDRGIVRECEARIAQGAVEAGVAAEISSAGLNKPCSEQYPSPSLLGLFAGEGVPVTLASDTHGRSRIGENNAQLLETARHVGYRSLRCFRGRKGQDLPLAPAAEDG